MLYVYRIDFSSWPSSSTKWLVCIIVTQKTILQPSSVSHTRFPNHVTVAENDWNVCFIQIAAMWPSFDKVWIHWSNWQTHLWIVIAFRKLLVYRLHIIVLVKKSTNLIRNGLQNRVESYHVLMYVVKLWYNYIYRGSSIIVFKDWFTCFVKSL